MVDKNKIACIVLGGLAVEADIGMDPWPMTCGQGGRFLPVFKLVNETIMMDDYQSYLMSYQKIQRVYKIDMLLGLSEFVKEGKEGESMRYVTAGGNVGWNCWSGQLLEIDLPDVRFILKQDGEIDRVGSPQKKDFMSVIGGDKIWQIPVFEKVGEKWYFSGTTFVPATCGVVAVYPDNGVWVGSRSGLLPSGKNKVYL
ncbi:MAG: hypothetical protein K6C34_02085 [Alphaproteobacteria bacterium]|nr:hypothetical protein [Alphaproteobacteria bacterium]